MGDQWCYECGEDKPIKYQAVFTPKDGGMPLYLIICVDCGREMASDAFSKLALKLFPSERGAVDLTFYPANGA